MKLTIVDLVLKAASMCHFCRQGERPIDDSSQDQGDVFVHKIGNIKTIRADVPDTCKDLCKQWDAATVAWRKVNGRYDP